MVYETDQTRPADWHKTGPIPDFGIWAEQVARSYTALTVDRTAGRQSDAGGFVGSIAACSLGDQTTLSRIQATPQTVRRRRQDIRNSPSDSVFVNIQIAGICKVSQAGLATLQKPGSVVLLDARRPFSMQFEAPFRQVCLHLPLADLNDDVGDITNAAGRLLRADSAAAAHLLHLVNRAALPDRNLLIQAVRHPYDAPADHRLSDDHLALIRDFIAARFADPDLRVETVAARFGISPRYVHRLFARTGQSFGRHLLQVRLAAARRRLEAEPSDTVKHIATDCGFASTSHFSHAFKAAYGLPPSQVLARTDIDRNWDLL